MGKRHLCLFHINAAFILSFLLPCRFISPLLGRKALGIVTLKSKGFQFRNNKHKYTKR